MHHLKCVVCKIRVRGQQQPAGGVGELCPVCGSLLEAVHNLSELVGLQERRRDGVTPQAVAMALSPPALRPRDT